MGLFKKNKKNKKNKLEKEGAVESKLNFSPVFSTPGSFNNAFGGTQEHIRIGKFNDTDVNVSLGALKCNNIVVINNNEESIKEQFVLPTIKQGKASYVIYDPDGKYYNDSAEDMKKMGYDVQLLDLSDPLNLSRVDLFETLNIIKNPYWLSLIISGSIKCNQMEIKIAHNILMSLLTYLLEYNEDLNLLKLYGLFCKIRACDKAFMQAIINSSAKQYLIAIMNSDKEVVSSAFEKLEKVFFKTAYNKTKDPNILTLASHLGKTIFYIKKVPHRYQYLATAFMLNLKTANIICGYGKTSTILIDKYGSDWYNKPLLDRICSEIGNMENSISQITICEKFNSDYIKDDDLRQVVIYMSSDDMATKEYVVEKTKIKNWNDNDLKLLSEKYFKGKEIPAFILDISPITASELDEIDDSIVFQPNKIASPFRCQRLID